MLPPPRVGAPSYEESWIRPWIGTPSAKNPEPAPVNDNIQDLGFLISGGSDPKYSVKICSVASIKKKLIRHLNFPPRLNHR